jgi:uncharacterized protein (TIGR03435 family)
VDFTQRLQLPGARSFRRCAEFTLTGATMEEWAYHRNDLNGADIVDMTHLPGRYDVTYTASEEEMCDTCTAPPRTDGQPATPGYKESLEKLGLRFEKQRA